MEHAILNTTSSIANNQNQTSLSQLISDEFLAIFVIVSLGFVNQIISLIGSVSNVINMIIYSRLGLQHGINLSLFALSISDFISCSTITLTNLVALPWIWPKNLTVNLFDFSYFVSDWPSFNATRISSCLTAFIMIERCICVAMPLKTSKIVTFKKSAFIIGGIFIAVPLAFAVPFYSSYQLSWDFDDNLNISVLGAVVDDQITRYTTVALTINLGLFTVIPALSTIICSLILVVIFKRRTEWFKTTGASQSVASRRFEKDKRLVKMVLVIALLFTSCYLPGMILIGLAFIFNLIDLSNPVFGNTPNFIVMTTYARAILENANGAFNIFIYYSCSSNYRNYLVQTILRGRCTQ